MSSNKTPKLPCTEERIYRKKLNSCDTCMKIAADKKQAMSLQRSNSTVECPIERIKSRCHHTSSKQTALTIRGPHPINMQENTYNEVNTLPNSSGNAKQVLQPFCVFEKSSTSNASGGQQNVTPEVVSNKEQNYQMKLKRRAAYMRITAEKKQAMLLQRRTKELQLQKTKSVIDCPVERTLSKQTTLTIREPSSANIQESTYLEVNTLSSSSPKGKEVVRPFCVFENYSTSNLSKGQQNVIPEVASKKGAAGTMTNF